MLKELSFLLPSFIQPAFGRDTLTGACSKMN